MNFANTINLKLDEHHLLKHDFYKAWNRGELKRSTLKTYATEYYHHVAAFPRYLSAIHSNCPDLAMRQVLLGNLIEEEQGDESHPELWQRFSDGLGATRNEIQQKPQLKETRELVDGYFELTKSDFATGLGALYAYERQTPDVSESKRKGLREFYNIEDERTLQFFTVHMEADKWHSDECAALINKLDTNNQEKAAKGAEMGAKLLWGFLDGMMVVHTTRIN